MSSLQPKTFSLMPVTSIQPRGWLANQLQIQLDGLTGHLDEFWPSVKDSAWFGGDLPDMERALYWLDGAIPLAWQMDDAALKGRITAYMNGIMDRQRSDGALGPMDGDESNLDRSRSGDPWSHILATKVMALYHDVTGEQRVFDSLVRYLKYLAASFARQPIFNWGGFRWMETLVAIFYVYEREPAEWLLEFARLVQMQGWDWTDSFASDDMAQPTARRGRWHYHKHVVNLAMCLKAYPLWSRVSGSDDDREMIHEMMNILNTNHGQAAGVFSGDECVSGTSPVQGTELCAVAEYIFSLGEAMSALGDADLGDRLERIVFNAWPATFSPDMWAHQYDQQANQVLVSKNPEHLWSTNGGDSNLYGLEPNFGCCTANMHMGWPKFVSHLWMRTAQGGVAATAYAPSRVSFTQDDVPVSVRLDTDYPFRETLTFTVTSESAVSFPLQLRIPQWCSDATITVDGEVQTGVAVGTFHTICQQWEGTHTVVLTLPMAARSERRYNNALTILRGPLVYSLKIGEEWKRVNENEPHRELPHADWEVHPTTPWNYALDVTEATLADRVRFEERPMGDCPFSPEGAPMQATVKGRPLTWANSHEATGESVNWTLRNGWADETPRSPILSTEPEEELTLIPYGCTNLRITEFPTLKEQSDPNETS